jgi:neutral trehalase
VVITIRIEELANQKQRKINPTNPLIIIENTTNRSALRETQRIAIVIVTTRTIKTTHDQREILECQPNIRITF